jgi:hypothetical protein
MHARWYINFQVRFALKNFKSMKTVIAVTLSLSAVAAAADQVLVPQIDGSWWQVAGDPDHS